MNDLRHSPPQNEQLALFHNFNYIPKAHATRLVLNAVSPCYCIWSQCYCTSYSPSTLLSFLSLYLGAGASILSLSLSVSDPGCSDSSFWNANAESPNLRTTSNVPLYWFECLILDNIPVEPHEAVAEVSRIGNV